MILETYGSLITHELVAYYESSFLSLKRGTPYITPYQCDEFLIEGDLLYKHAMEIE